MSAARDADALIAELRAALTQIACGTFRNAKGQIRQLRREGMMRVARRICRGRGWSFDKLSALRRSAGGPLPLLTVEQRKTYRKLRRLLGREAAIEAALGAPGSADRHRVG